MEAQPKHYSGLKSTNQRNRNFALVTHKLRYWFAALSEFCQCLLVDQDELKISQRIDRHGQPRWYIYNPSTQKTHCFDSEAEVRVWIEQRYSGASR